MAKRTKSALKANRQNITRREHNRQMRSTLRTALKGIRAKLEEKDLDGAKAALTSDVGAAFRRPVDGLPEGRPYLAARSRPAARRDL